MNYEILIHTNGNVSLVDVMRTNVDRANVIGVVSTPISRLITPGMMNSSRNLSLPTTGIYLFMTDTGPVLSDVGRGDIIPPGIRSMSGELSNLFTRHGMRTRVSKVATIEPVTGIIFNPEMRTFGSRNGVYRQRAAHCILGWKAGLLPNQAYHALIMESGDGSEVRLVKSNQVTLYCSQKIPAARIAGHETVNVRCAAAESITINGELQTLTEGVATYIVPSPAKNIEIGLTFNSNDQDVLLGGVEVW